jgi:hypothetical protein
VCACMCVCVFVCVCVCVCLKESESDRQRKIESHHGSLITHHCDGLNDQVYKLS